MVTLVALEARRREAKLESKKENKLNKSEINN